MRCGTPPSLSRCRRTLLAGGLAALALAAPCVSSARASEESADRPAGAATPPTAAQVEARTGRFLDRLGPSAPASPRALRDGGIGLEPPPGYEEDALFPERRVVGFYGAPQLGSTVLGKRRPKAAGEALREQARPYRRLGERPVVPAFDLIATIATASRGSDGKYRTRQPDEVIASYLRQVRRLGGRLILDIQPGRSKIVQELRAFRRWIAEPDVDVAIDPEWNVGRRGVPGRTQGSVTEAELDEAARFIGRITTAGELPEKTLIVHQFREGSVKGRKRVRSRPGVDVLLNFDGIGSPAAKRAGYANLTAARLFNGFSLFYELDSRLMSPRSVLALDPTADYVMYQ